MRGLSDSTIYSFVAFLLLQLQCEAIDKCINCPDEWTDVIRGIVHRSLYQEHRNTYYPFYSDWIDELSKPEINVHIKYVSYKDLDALKFQKLHPRTTERKEHYNILYTFTDPTVTGTEMSEISQSIDQFLTMNPCWLPLLEPCAFNCSNAKSGSTHPPHDAPHYRNSVVLLKLPSVGFTDTCQLYEHIVQRQFPEKCRYDSGHMVSFAVHNIGWSHTLHTMVDVMLNTFTEKEAHKVFVIPYADVYIGKHVSFKLSNGTLIKRRNSGWYWANEVTCPTDDYLFNPWACNFLSISHCSNRNSTFDIPPDTKKRSWDDYSYLPKSIGIDWKSRLAHLDAPSYDDRKWVENRLISFVTRPNARLRQMIRRSLHRIRVLSPRPQIDGLQKPLTVSQGLGHRDATVEKSRKFVNFHGKNAGLIQHIHSAPCIALHVRHGDSIYDSRNNIKTDRSFHAHVNSLKNVSLRLGTTVVYLLTDNATLPSYAAEAYPEYNWLMQSRPMKKSIRVFDVKNENDIQLELSHVLADIIFGGSCVAVVACFDSGMATQVRRAVADRTQTGLLHSDQAVDVVGNVVRGWVPVSTA